MECEGLVVADLDELANRWQIPLGRVMYYITDCGMPMDDEGQGKWFSDNWDLIIAEKQKAFEESLFPRELRPETPEPTP